MSRDSVIQQGTSPLRVLVVRPDRMGDVILSSPVFEVIKKHYARSHLTVLLREATVPVVEGLSSVDDVIIFDPAGRHAGFRGFLNLVRDIRNGHFRIAVVLQSHWKVAAAIYFARVRYRVGPLSKLHSFFFYNRGVRQRRSQVEMHETDYNLQLLRRLGIRMGSRKVPTRVHVTPDAIEDARKWLSERGWKEGAPLITIHPGMGGSALNWPETHYVDLIKGLVKEGQSVLITGGPLDTSLIGRIQDALGSAKERVMIRGRTETYPLSHLAGLFHWSSVVVAPSTGPLHLAVALGRPVVTFYPPIRVQSAIRWGPYTSTPERTSILVPEVFCGQDFSCLGSHCNYYPCMKSLTVSQALEETRRQLAQSRELPNA